MTGGQRRRSRLPRLKEHASVFNIRWGEADPELRERLIQAARLNRRSLHAEILIRLERSFKSEKEVAA